MKNNRVALIVLIGVLILGGAGYYAYVHFKSTSSRLPSSGVAPITVPEGFAATIFSNDVPGARVMIHDQKGTILVSLTESGKIVALPDKDHNGKADQTVTVLENLTQPHGMAVLCKDPTTDICTLYVAETDEVKSYSYNADTFTTTDSKVLTTLPSGDGHFTRTLLIAPDQRHLLVSIGSSCNVCDEAVQERASVQSLDLATNKMTPYATGLRNSVFMAIDPVGGGIWATENGRDNLGDDIPPDEINVLRQGKDYGWPICYGQNIHDTDFDKKQYFRDPCTDTVSPRVQLQAHSAALGLMFIPEDSWPQEYRNDLLVAFHGSWNRSQPTGYKVVRIHLDPNTRQRIGAPIDFATGFLPADGKSAEDALGRPVGFLAEVGGVVYISDDKAGAIYRVAYQGAPQ